VGGIWHGWQVPLCLAALYFVGLVVGARATRRLRTSIHSLRAATVIVAGSRYVEGDLELLEGCVNEFERLDREREGNRIEPVQYESAWARLYAVAGSTPHA
jgi:hypothetical protein